MRIVLLSVAVAAAVALMLPFAGVRGGEGVQPAEKAEPENYTDNTVGAVVSGTLATAYVARADIFADEGGKLHFLESAPVRDKPFADGLNRPAILIRAGFCFPQNEMNLIRAL